MSIFDDIGSFLGFGGNQNSGIAQQGPMGPTTPLDQIPQDFAIQGPQQQGASNLGAGIPGGFYDITGDSPAGRRGDEITDTIDLASFVLQGAGPGWIKMEARRRKYTKADFNAVTRVRSSLEQVASQLGFAGGGAQFNPAFFQVMAQLSKSLGQGRRKKRAPSLSRMVVALKHAGALLRLLQSAGRGLARATAPVVVSRAPAHLAQYQFRRKVSAN